MLRKINLPKLHTLTQNWCFNTNRLAFGSMILAFCLTESCVPYKIDKLLLSLESFRIEHTDAEAFVEPMNLPNPAENGPAAGTFRSEGETLIRKLINTKRVV